MRPLLFTLLTLALPAGAQTLILEGEVPPPGEDAFFEVPFEVPEGVAELRIEHSDLSNANILDWGLYDPAGFRGWGGGNTEPVVLSAVAASRSYLPGPIRAGTWQVVVGRARIVEHPARYRVEITFSDTEELAPSPPRRPYVPVPPLETGARWYAGDFHVHSRESGDAHPTLDAIASFAVSRGLDFVEVSDHNTVSHVGLLPDLQDRHPGILLLPGVEFTTYGGHANGIGASAHVDHRFTRGGGTMREVSQAFAAQGALLSINHPGLDLADICIGCSWTWPLDGADVAAVELGTGAYSRGGFLFQDRAIAFWDALLDEGRQVAGIGGSDDHRGGVDHDWHQSPIGSPTTLVWAEALSHEAILEGVRRGRTVVKLEGPEDPMIDLVAHVEGLPEPARLGDTVRGPSVLSATITGGGGHRMRWVRNGQPEEPLLIDADPFEVSRAVEPPNDPSIQHRYRLEVLVDDAVRTLTSHLYVAAALPEPPPDPQVTGCSCNGSTGAFALGGAGLVGMWSLGRRRRKRR